MKELVEKWRSRVSEWKSHPMFGAQENIQAAGLQASAYEVEQCIKELKATLSPRPIEEAKLGCYHWCRRKESGQWWMCFVRAKSPKDVREGTGAVIVMSDGEAYSVKDFDLAVLVPLPSMDGGKSNE